jgi:phage terminase large subunit-like protein
MCDFIEQNEVFGPGDLLGQPARISEEKRAFIYRAYEVWPRNSDRPGRRRFRRVALSLQKGDAKTELGVWIAAAELHPAAPVRCDGFRGNEPIGRPVIDPYIPLLAYTEEQSEELAYYALKTILEESPIAGDFDIGLERIVRTDGHGKAVALAGAPSARDGARTTFQFFDETHHWTLPRLVRAHSTMLKNLLKRPAADPWALETTTAPVPGENSVAEKTMDYGEAVAEGRMKDSRIFFFHRQASDGYDLDDRTERRAAVTEAAGPNAEWKDIDGMVQDYEDPQTDKAQWEQVFLNRKVQGSNKAFDLQQWKALGKKGAAIADGRLITLGFDGSRYDDATALVAVDVETNFAELVGLWEKPLGNDDWSVPETEVDAAVALAFERWDVWRMYPDPYFWEGWIALWISRYGEERIVRWPTNRLRQMAEAIQELLIAIREGKISHDGNEDLARHVGNACKKTLQIKDGEGRSMFVIQKERGDSPNKIDAAMALGLAEKARTDAIAANAKPRGNQMMRSL